MVIHIITKKDLIKRLEVVETKLAELTQALAAKTMAKTEPFIVTNKIIDEWLNGAQREDKRC